MNATKKKRPVVVSPATAQAIVRLRDACDQLAMVDWGNELTLSSAIGALQFLVPAALANLETGEQFARPEQASRRAEPESDAHA